MAYVILGIFMSEKIGSDVISKKKLKRELMKANKIQIQLQALEELAKKPMNCTELREFIEDLGGNHYLLLPILKNTGLVKTEEGYDGRRGRHFVYSLRRAPTQPL